MGPSGCGKTTLLDVISGRKTRGTIEGVVHYGTSEASKSFLSRNTGYVEQFDTLVDNLTVREMLEYTAEMKLPHTKPKVEKKAAVEKIVAKLSLEKCCNTVIGNATQRGISGGQAKRVNIGVSIIVSISFHSHFKTYLTLSLFFHFHRLTPSSSTSTSRPLAWIPSRVTK